MSRISRREYLFLNCLQPLMHGGAKRISPVAAGDRTAFDSQPKVAIVAGVSTYKQDSGLGALGYGVKDAKSIGAALRLQGYVVRELLDSDVTSNRIREAIAAGRRLLAQRSPGGERCGTLLFFFSGHGFMHREANHLATYDSMLSQLDSSGIAIDDLPAARRDPKSPPSVEGEMKKTVALRRVLWIDACRNTPVAGGKGPNPLRSLGRMMKSEGTQKLSSSAPGRFSYEDPGLSQGVFTYFLLRGLAGEAAKEDGWITFKDLADYVMDQVPRYSACEKREQIPYQAGEGSGEFLIGRGIPSSLPVPEGDTTPAPLTQQPPPELSERLSRLQARSAAIGQVLDDLARSSKDPLHPSLSIPRRTATESLDRAAKDMAAGRFSQVARALDAAESDILTLEESLFGKH